MKVAIRRTIASNAVDTELDCCQSQIEGSRLQKVVNVPQISWNVVSVFLNRNTLTSCLTSEP